MRGPHWLLASYLKRTRNNSKTRLYLGLIDCNWNLCYFPLMISLQGPLAFQQAENHTEWCAHLRWISLPEAGAILVTWWNASPPLGVVSKSLEPQNAQTKGPWFEKIQHHFDIDAHRLARPYPYPFYSTSWTDYISQPLQIQPLTLPPFPHHQHQSFPNPPPRLTPAELLNLPVGHARNVGIGFQRGLIRFTVKADAIRRGICLMGENIRRVKGFLHVILSYRIYAGKDWSI